MYLVPLQLYDITAYKTEHKMLQHLLWMYPHEIPPDVTCMEFGDVMI